MLYLHSRTYAGIGSRETPRSVCEAMTLFARVMSAKSLTLFSGGARGADVAFERGAGDNKIIFLPWKGFNKSTSLVVPPLEPAIPFVERFHPKPSSLTDEGWKFMARNTYQVLGPDLQSPVDFVVCWTKDGKASGGTGQACRLAKHYGIPIFNFNGEVGEIRDLATRIKRGVI